MKQLIVNADDFGMSDGVNRGIIEAHERGIVTSASLMVRGAAAKEGARLAHTYPQLSVGLHVDLCEWEYRDGQWRLRYSVVPVNDAKAVGDEFAQQLQTFRDLMGGEPTHLDSHQHVHRDEPLRSILSAVGVPVRHFHPQIKYCGKFYGQSDKGYPFPEGITVESLLSILHGLPEGITEMGCHPAAVADMDSCYRNERVVELQTLCDPRLKTVDIKLSSFREVA